MGATLRATTDYSLFELHEFNRDTRRMQYLKESMKRYGWIDAYPMHVVRNGSKKLKIKGGHHRFEVAKDLGIPVKFVVCNDGGVTIHELEKATNKWTPQDYLTSYVRQGLPAYIRVKEYIEETGIPLCCAVSLLAGESAGSYNKINQFKDGSYRLGDQMHADRIKNIVLHMQDCGISFANNSYFIKALSKVLWVKEFDISRFKKKICTHANIFEMQPNVSEYMNSIELVYNRASKDRLPVVFMANEISNKRRLTFGRE